MDITKPNQILHGGMFKPLLRKWQGTNCRITADNLMYPVFIVEKDNDEQAIEAMPGVSRFGIVKLLDHLRPLVAQGLSSVLLFGVIDSLPKDSTGTSADSQENPVIRAIPLIKASFPNLIIACDVCLCPYTSHGHCGLLDADGHILNADSCVRIAEIALAYARAGCDIVAPSDMMDGRIAAIKSRLIDENLANRVALLSYAIKFASSFYGPFRAAAKSAPAFGDRQAYQLPGNARGLALRAARRDVDQGADMLMVKPGLAYLDLVRDTKELFPEYPLFVYQVSGEYSMITLAGNKGVVDFKNVVLETLTSMRRAGADVIITYFTPAVLNWIEHGQV